MNAAIRAATLVARAHGVDAVGIERGDRGPLDGAFVAACADGSIARWRSRPSSAAVHARLVGSVLRADRARCRGHVVEDAPLL